MEGGRERRGELREGHSFTSFAFTHSLSFILSYYFHPTFNRMAQGKQQASALGAVGGGCGCVDEVIHVSAAVSEKGGGRGVEDDPRNPNSRV